MRIIYLSNSVIPSRTANSISVMKMCQAYADLGHEVTLLAPNRYYSFEQNVDDTYDFYGVKNNFSIEHLAAPKIRGNFLIYLFQCARYLRRNKADLITGQFPQACAIATALGLPTILEAHGPSWKNRWMEKFALNKLASAPSLLGITTNSPSLKEMYLQAGYLDGSKIIATPNGADIPTPTSKEITRWQNTTDRLQIGYFGHLFEGRGIEIIIGCAKKLVDMDFHIVGGTEVDIEKWKSQSNDITNIIFHGFIPQNKIQSYREQCDILLAPYQKHVGVFAGKEETSAYMCPMKIIEYLSSKRTFIASDLPAIRALVDDEVATFAQPDDIDDWTTKINSLRSKATRESVAAKGYDLFLRELTWLKRAEKTLSLIDGH